MKYAELEYKLEWLFDLDSNELAQLLLSIITDASNQEELIKYLENWNEEK